MGRKLKSLDQIVDEVDALCAQWVVNSMKAVMPWQVDFSDYEVTLEGERLPDGSVICTFELVKMEAYENSIELPEGQEDSLAT